MDSLKSMLSDARTAYEKCVLNLSFTCTPELQARWDAIQAAFAQDELVWDITAEHEPCKITGERGEHIVSNLERRQISFGESPLDVLKCDTPALFLENANGANFYFYPFFVVMEQSNSVAILSPNELQISGNCVEVIENDLPSGATVCDQVWARAKKDGSPDMRYKDNATIPIAEYYRMNIHTMHGVQESYLFCQPSFGKTFAKKLVDYCSTPR